MAFPVNAVSSVIDLDLVLFGWLVQIVLRFSLTIK